MMRGKIVVVIMVMVAFASSVTTAPYLQKHSINLGFNCGAVNEEMSDFPPCGEEEVNSIKDGEKRIPHFAIHINGNNEFTKMLKGVVEGSGTSDDPYIISNWHIIPSLLPGVHPLIHIENTNAHFIIRNCYIHGIRISNILWNDGIYFHNVTNGKIENCHVENCLRGIWIHNSTYNTVENCYIKEEYFGIYIRRSSHNVVRNCECDGCTISGITISWGNDPYNEYEHIPSSYNTIENCICHGIRGKDEIIGAGIYLCCLANSTGNRIMNCTCYDNEYGILLHNWIYNTTVYGCTLSNNDYGLRVYTGGDNCIYHNAFIDNKKWQAYDPNNDTWCDMEIKEGNYWSDYGGIDNDGDGIGDIPYKIPGGDNVDWYPLMMPP